MKYIATIFAVLSFSVSAQDIRETTATVLGMSTQLGGYYGAAFGETAIALDCAGGVIDNAGTGGIDSSRRLDGAVCPDCVLGASILLDSYRTGVPLDIRYFQVPNQPGECRFAAGGVRYALPGGDGDPVPPDPSTVPDNPRCDLDPVSWAGCWVDWWADHGTGETIPLDPACQDDDACWEDWWAAL